MIGFAFFAVVQGSGGKGNRGVILELLEQEGGGPGEVIDHADVGSKVSRVLSFAFHAGPSTVPRHSKRLTCCKHLPRGPKNTSVLTAVRFFPSFPGVL